MSSSSRIDLSHSIGSFHDQRAMDSSVKFSLVANSIKLKIVIEPKIEIVLF